MANKEKRLRKILSKMCLKGRFKLAATPEEAHIVLIDERKRPSFYLLEKDSYLKAIENGYIFSEEGVYFLVSANPRNRRLVEQKYLTNAFADVKPISK